MRDDLSALVFELQRAGSKVDKAKALARAWRTVRGLSATERQLLAREVGFDGAEDLIEGLAGRGSGVFAPAAVLEALGKMRREEGFSLRGILSGLRDPDKRDDLLVRGIDLVADSLKRPEEEDDPQEWTDGSVDFEIPPPAPPVGVSRENADTDDRAGDHDHIEAPEPSPPPQPEKPPAPEEIADHAPSVEPDPVTAYIPEAVDPSSWDEMWGELETVVAAPSFVGRAERRRTSRLRLKAKKTEGSVLHRLRAFREAIPGLENATVNQFRDALDELPEAWARRRALVALIDADVPDEVSRILDLIDDLDRAMDRRWCLSALARRGDLSGADLERALGMITSPAARRRVGALARGA